MASKSYAIRYMIQPWNKPPEPDHKPTRIKPGIAVSPNDFGYTDRIVLISILDEDTDLESILILDSVSNPPSLDLLEKIKAAIEHQIECHT